MVLYNKFKWVEDLKGQLIPKGIKPQPCADTVYWKVARRSRLLLIKQSEKRSFSYHVVEIDLAEGEIVKS